MLMQISPWSNEQVANMNEFQTNGRLHPFTCPNRGDGKHPERNGDHGTLRATNECLVCDDCEYKQYWAHDFMVEIQPGQYPLPNPEYEAKRAAIVAFAKKHKRIINSKEFASVFQIAALHHCGYTGETYADEFENMLKIFGITEEELK
jgi:hypothetical protein